MNWSNGARDGMITGLLQMGPPKRPSQTATIRRASRTRLSMTWDPYLGKQQR
jgi:hypothetical protein